MAHGKHAKKKEFPTKQIAIGATAIVGGAVVPVSLAGTATAASVNDWDRVARCESSGQWNRPDGDFGKSSGGLQFQPASWNDALEYLRKQGVDTSSYPQEGFGHQAYKATKQQQIIAGEALLALQGPGAWTCNAKVGYPLQSSGPHGSMFKGGINPYPGNSSETPKGDRPAKPDSSEKPKSDRPAPKTKPEKTSNEDAKYVVVKGDWLVKIANRFDVKGGWPALYGANKNVVGSNPNLIFPGQKLVIPGKSEAPAQEAPKPEPVPPKPDPVSDSFKAPVSGAVTQLFGNPRSSYTLGYHTGIDITAPQGTPVYAPTDGTVVSSDTSWAYGTNVQVKHAGGVYTLYAHLAGKVVSPGQTVNRGQLLGYVGSTGNSSGPHLHMELRTQPKFAAGNFLDPLKWLRSNGVSY